MSVPGGRPSNFRVPHWVREGAAARLLLRPWRCCTSGRSTRCSPAYAPRRARAALYDQARAPVDRMSRAARAAYGDRIYDSATDRARAPRSGRTPRQIRSAVALLALPSLRAYFAGPPLKRLGSDRSSTVAGDRTSNLPPRRKSSTELRRGQNERGSALALAGSRQESQSRETYPGGPIA